MMVLQGEVHVQLCATTLWYIFVEDGAFVDSDRPILYSPDSCHELLKAIIYLFLMLLSSLQSYLVHGHVVSTLLLMIGFGAVLPKSIKRTLFLCIDLVSNSFPFHVLLWHDRLEGSQSFRPIFYFGPMHFPAI